MDDKERQQLPDNHQQIIDRFVAVCQADERIIAAFLGGSYAEGRADKYSDLDLYVVTSNAAYDDLLVERARFIRLLGEPLFLEDFGRPNGNFVIFSNATEIEIWFGRERAFTAIHSGSYKVLLDRKDILAGSVFRAPVADQTEQTELLRRQLEYFWHDLGHFIKAMGRGQLWFAYGQLEILRQLCVKLARLRYNFADPEAAEEPYFKVEQALPVEQLSPLESTCCSIEYAAMLHAARVMCRYYHDVASDLAEAHHLRYQTELEAILMHQLSELEDSRSS